MKYLNGGVTIKLNGQLEIDCDRGVIYFHTVELDGVITPLRICNLPAPIPAGKALDIIHMQGCNWRPGGAKQ